MSSFVDKIQDSVESLFRPSSPSATAPQPLNEAQLAQKRQKAEVSAAAALAIARQSLATARESLQLVLLENMKRDLFMGSYDIVMAIQHEQPVVQPDSQDISMQDAAAAELRNEDRQTFDDFQGISAKSTAVPSSLLSEAHSAQSAGDSAVSSSASDGADSCGPEVVAAVRQLPERWKQLLAVQLERLERATMVLDEADVGTFEDLRLRRRECVQDIQRMQGKIDSLVELVRNYEQLLEAVVTADVTQWTRSEV